MTTTTTFRIFAAGRPSPGCPDIDDRGPFTSRAEAEAALDEWRGEFVDECGAETAPLSADSEIAARSIRIVEE